MRRDIDQDLIRWKDQAHPLPLLLRGARQVGKSFVVENFAENHFKNCVTINFEFMRHMTGCFESLDPVDIINKIFTATNQKITPNKTLLFLDEIQECPSAILALRYFKEKMPEQHVIAAGSLLEFTLNNADFRMPVGRVQSLYLKPLSFKEYLTAGGHGQLREFIENINLNTEIPEFIHNQLLKLVREYMILGGMPSVLQHYFTNRDQRAAEDMQTLLLNAYRQDFGKYAKQTDHQYLQLIFEKIPFIIGEHVKFSKIDPDVKSREIKRALSLLKNAGLLYPVRSVGATGVPLTNLVNDRIFKLIFLDTGLITRSGKLAMELLLNKDVLSVNRGALAEQFVGQELLANESRYDETQLYFWERNKPSSMAEVDFVTMVDANIIPVEVKAGATGHLKSIKLFIEEKNSKLGVRFSQHPFSYIDKILSLPLYMVSEMPRITRSIIY